MPTLTVATAWPLWLLAALPLVWLLAWRNRASVARARLIGATLLRSLAVAAIVVALTRPTLHQASDAVSVAYVVDVSHSISPRFVDEALAWIAQIDARHRPAQSRFVVFADRARLVDSIDQVRSVALAQPDTETSNADVIDQGATNLEEALVTALLSFASGPAQRVVLFSDGNQTEGDVWRAMLRAQAQGARVFAIPAVVSADNDAWVEALVVPEGVREQGPVEIGARVFSRSAARAHVELSVGGHTLASRALSLVAGDNRLALPVRFARAGLNDVTLRVTAEGDQVPRNDVLTESVLVRPRPHVLYVESHPPSAHYLADVLRVQGIRVTVANAEALSADAALLGGKDVVILSDVRADALSALAARRLQAFVRDRGGGLIFAAGENTYGKDGYAGSDLERLLPVKFEAKRKRKDLDLVLLIDRSHSMRGRKLELAKSAALATLDLLDEQHRLAVVAFDSRPRDVVALAPVGSKRRAEDRIAAMTSSGQTNIYNALAHAQRLLADSAAATKHIILLSDGVTAPPPGGASVLSSSEAAQERIRKVREDTIRQVGGVRSPEAGAETPASPGGFPAVVAELAAAKVTLSTVAIGDKPDLELMANLAKWGEGKSYVARTDAEIPGLFVAETRRLLGESIVEEAFRPTLKAASPLVAGLDFAAGPALKGYVVGKPKRFSEVLLQAKDRPLLAETRYGLGKTVVFLSDVKNRWAADWLDWPGYAKLWAQVVRASARRDGDEGLSWRVSREGREARVRLTALDGDGNYRSALFPRIRVTTPGGQSSVVALRQRAPGDYRAEVPLKSGGSTPWRLELLPGPGIGSQDLARAGSRTLFYPYSDEYRTLPVNGKLLGTLSEQTGGAYAPKTEEIFSQRGDGGLIATRLWPYLAFAALLLFLLDILVRRAPWPVWRSAIASQKRGDEDAVLVDYQDYH